MADEDLRALRESVETGFRSAEVTLTELRGDIARVEQKVDLRHEETLQQGDRLLEAERDIDKLQQGHAQTKAIGGLLGAAAGIVVAFLKDALMPGKG